MSHRLLLIALMLCLNAPGPAQRGPRWARPVHLGATPLAASQPQVVASGTAKSKPASCNPQPPAYTTFATTDSAAYLWFTISGLNKGDVIDDEFSLPSGDVYTDAGVTWNPISSAGAYCFIDELDIAANVASSFPGTKMRRWRRYPTRR